MAQIKTITFCFFISLGVPSHQLFAQDAANDVADPVGDESKSSVSVKDGKVDDSEIETGVEDYFPGGTPIKICSCESSKESKRPKCIFQDAEDESPTAISVDFTSLFNSLSKDCKKLVKDDPSVLNGFEIRLAADLTIGDAVKPCTFKKTKKGLKLSEQIKKACTWKDKPAE